MKPNPINFRALNLFDRSTQPLELNELQRQAKQALLDGISAGRIAITAREKCLCGGIESIQLAAIDRFGLPFGSYLCKDCGLIYTSPYISPDSLPLYYDQFYHPLTFGRPVDPTKPLFSKDQGTKIFHLIGDRLPVRPLSVLEIGAGPGTVLKEFAKAAAEKAFKIKGTGVEYSREYVARFDPEGFDLKMFQGGIDAAHRGTHPYDVVIMSHVFEHFADPRLEIENLKHMISPETLIYIEVPGVLSIKQRYVYDCDFLKYLTSAHLFNFNLTSLTFTVNKYGLKLLWGNEEVESIFTLGPQEVDPSANAALIKSYIQDSEISRPLYASLAPESLKNRLGIKQLEASGRDLKASIAVMTREHEAKFREHEAKFREHEAKFREHEANLREHGVQIEALDKARLTELEIRERALQRQLADVTERLRSVSAYLDSIRSSFVYRFFAGLYRIVKKVFLFR